MVAVVRFTKVQRKGGNEEDKEQSLTSLQWRLSEIGMQARTIFSLIMKNNYEEGRKEA